MSKNLYVMCQKVSVTFYTIKKLPKITIFDGCHETSWLTEPLIMLGIIMVVYLSQSDNWDDVLNDFEKIWRYFVKSGE